MERLLTIQQVTEIVGFKKPTIYKYIREQNFPKPIKTGNRASRWSYQEVMEWIENLKQNREVNNEKVS
ncbi:helix-turn-helix transcriptional regulator [Nitrosophilus labii]|uniref:helix-turn-helix transcriptional regulator n=1 Tax=Nitrosophilus labii TaxID=2706014 RepID=UPI001656B733|nr:AlpA family phage regulatory protein [Nitrosophilus labii]